MSSAEVDALLEGLCAEDLDMDFDPNEEEMMDEVVDVDVGFDDCGPSFIPAGPDPSTSFVGFVTGRNTVIPAPSSEAFAKARKIFDEDPVLAEVASTLEEPPHKRQRRGLKPSLASAIMPPPPSGFATATGKAPPAISSSAQAAAEYLFDNPTALAISPTDSSTNAESSSFSRRSSFATAGGRAPPVISLSARASTATLFKDTMSSRPPSVSPPKTTTGFATATGRPPPPISPAAASASKSLFRQVELAPEHVSAGLAAGRGGTPPPVAEEAAESTESLFSLPDPNDSFDAKSRPGGTFSLGFSTGAGNIVAPPSSAARAKAMAMFDDGTPGSSYPNTHETPPFVPPTSSTPGPAMRPTSSLSAKQRIGAIYLDDQQIRPSQGAATPSFIAPRAPISRQSATGSIFRTPLRATTNTPPAPAKEHTGSPALRKFKPIEIGTPVPRRRVGLGMTPSRFGKGKSAGFSSPFKVGPVAIPPPRAPAPPVVVPLLQPVFDVTKPPDRKTYRGAYLKPQYHSLPELIERGIPQEIFLMELRIAKAYRFVGDDDGDLGPVEALIEVKKAGCDLATPAWVLNHWCMILWKLAGVIQAQYSLYDRLWRWEEVICQLLYRYEREYGRAERPIVRRIHEHDSSPSLPLVLCVSAIVQPPPPVLEEGDKEEPVRPVLELTDGWYRISAQVDECLSKHIGGKIRVGRKLAITGAKLESSGEGVDPLESLDKTLLVIAGNSTKLAAWDAKLGRQNEPFVSGLSSLSVDGGIVALMDVMIDKLFPLAYSSADRGNRDAPWGEEEERQRQDVWTEKYAAESSRLQEEQRRQLERIEDVVTALCSAAEGLNGGGDSPDNVEQIFESLLQSPSIDSRLRTMASSTLVHVATYGRSYHEREAGNAFLEVEAELQVSCPPRQVRDFRIARVFDARRGDKAVCRAGMLTVWDAKALGEGALVEGQRYMVANVTPGRAGDWRPPGVRQDGSKAEIYLHTRKDTRWQIV